MDENKTFHPDIENQIQKIDKAKAESVLSDLLNFIDDYIETYELRADEGDYTPTEQERMLIYDAFYGLIADEEFIQKWDTWRKAKNKQ